jgi:hypothetical protein
MLIKILPGEYLWSEQGFHVLNSDGFAMLAAEEREVEVTDEVQLAIIAEYHRQVRPQPEEPADPQGETTNG